MSDVIVPATPGVASTVNAEFLGKFTRVATGRRLALEALKDMTTKNAASETALTAARAELAALKGHATTQRVSSLEGDIRQRDYRAAFNTAATAAGARPGHLDRLFKLAEIDTSKPEIDPAAMTAVVTKFKGEVPEFFGEAAAIAKPPAPETGIFKPAPGSGKGASLAPLGGMVVDEAAAMNDAAYAVKNYAKIQAAYKAKHNI